MDAAKERRKNFKEAQKQREAERLELIELQKQRDIYNKRLLDYDNAEIERLEVLGKSTFEKRKALLEEQKLTAEQNGKFTESIRIQTKIIALEKERNEKAIAYANKRLEIARQIQDLELEILEDGVEKEVEISNVKFDRLLEDLKTNTEITAKERKRLTELYLFQQQEAENDIRNQFRQDQLNAEKEFGVESINVSELTANKEVETTFNKYAAMGAISMQYYKDEEDLRERNKQFAIDSAFQTLDLISNITELFGKKGEKQAKKAFKVQKAAQIATTLGTTYLSATQAYASQFLPLPDPSSPVRGGIAAGLAVAAGLANVAKIASQKFEGGGATGSTSVGGSVPEAPSAPQFNVVGDSGVNQLATLQQQPTQAFVVSGEVTTAQALDRNRVQNATL
ncbi:tail tape measure protein [uncultured Mediterranean phage uvDeep-CGR1-KM17-C101]|nr:tail tape measure protein [uncultured Mediterranean phage uvDeep-CGR1-KM17-C101]